MQSTPEISVQRQNHENMIQIEIETSKSRPVEQESVQYSRFIRQQKGSMAEVSLYSSVFYLIPRRTNAKVDPEMTKTFSDLDFKQNSTHQHF